MRPARGMLPVALAALAVALAAASPCAAAPEGRALPSASDGVHAWLAVERATESGIEHALLHHAGPMGCDCAREAITLPRRPEAMAAHDGRVWVVLEAEPGGRREVFSQSARRNPATGAYFSDPAGRMEIHPSLPADGALLAVSAQGGALAVLREGAGPESLGARGWAAAPDRVDLAAPADALRAPVQGAMAPADLVREPSGARSIRYRTPAGDLLLTAFDPPERAFAVLGVGGRFGIFVPTGDGGAAVRWVDAVDGTVFPQAVLGPQPASAAQACSGMAGVGLAGCLAGLLAWRFLRLKSASGERR
jgi:hypothetical protein